MKTGIRVDTSFLCPAIARTDQGRTQLTIDAQGKKLKQPG